MKTVMKACDYFSKGIKKNADNYVCFFWFLGQVETFLCPFTGCCHSEHLQATADMLPHFFSMDKTNYSRWLPVYLADMSLLEETAPEVHQEFLNGNHAVSRSSQPFSQIWMDMALKQSVNLDSKSK